MVDVYIPGPMGPQGPKGDKGDKGDTGFTGPQGERGFKGDQGDKGFKGDQGERGPQGLQGPEGAYGLRGPQGLRGLPGATGERGYQGLPGPVGPIGPRGPAGNAMVIKTIDHVWWKLSDNPEVMGPVEIIPLDLRLQSTTTDTFILKGDGVQAWSEVVDGETIVHAGNIKCGYIYMPKPQDYTGRIVTLIFDLHLTSMGEKYNPYNVPFGLSSDSAMFNVICPIAADYDYYNDDVTVPGTAYPMSGETTWMTDIVVIRPNTVYEEYIVYESGKNIGGWFPRAIRYLSTGSSWYRL